MEPCVRVYPLPPQLPHNPYLDQLYGHLHDPRIEVRRLRPARRGLVELLSYRGAKIWHVHFFDEIVQRRARPASQLRTRAFLALLALVRASGARVVWTAHNLEPHELYHADLAHRVYLAMMRAADAVLVHSRSAGEALTARYGRPRRLDVIPMGNAAGLGGPPRDRAAARAQLGWPEGDRVILGLGTLRPYKGFEDLIDAFASSELSGARLVIAGHVQDEAYGKALAQRCAAVRAASLLTGYIADDKLPVYLAAADVVVLPYHKMLNSAMLSWPLSYAAPVVVAAFPPISELLSDGISAFLYPPGDVSGLRAALARALGHPDLAGVGRAGQRAVSEFDWPRSAERLAAVYLEVAQCG